MKNKPSEEYLLKAQKLSRTEAERLFSRMGGKLGRRLEDSKIIPVEALALQLQKEDEKLREWRERRNEIRQREGEKED